MKLILPLPPSVNEAWRSVAMYRKIDLQRAVSPWNHHKILRALRVNVTKSQAYREYLKRLEVPLAAQRTEILEGDVSLDVIVFFKDRRRDLDGTIKILLDVLEGVCYTNDKQVAELRFRREIDKDTPRVEVTVTSFAPQLFSTSELDATQELEF